MAKELRGRLPVKVDATSNGEFRPVPLTEPVARANHEAERRIGEQAKRVGIGRRAFLQSNGGGSDQDAKAGLSANGRSDV